MALSPAQKTRKSPRPGSTKKLGVSSSPPKTSPKSGSVNKELFQEHPLTCVTVKKKRSLSKERSNIPTFNKEEPSITKDDEEKKEGKKGSFRKRKALDGDGECRRTKSPGVRVIGGRIYDSENGKTCHQCRQKTMEFMASCKNVTGNKTCTMNFCPKCLLNRYGEKVEDAVKSKEWNCPKCRTICNCSICMKKQGCAPTGILAHAAKATGFASVSDLLQCQNLTPEQVDTLNETSLSGFLDSLCSGTLNVKELVKKLRPMQGSLILKESIESPPLEEQSVPLFISLLKDKKIKMSLNRPSTPSKEGKHHKSSDESSAPTESGHLESKVISQFKELANLGGSSKSIKRKGNVASVASDDQKVLMDINDGKIDTGKDPRKVSDALCLSDEAVATKKKSKKNIKLKGEVEHLEKDLCGRGGAEIVTIKKTEKALDVSLCANVSKVSSPKIKGQVMHESKETKDCKDVHEATQPLGRKKLTKINRKQDKADSLGICSSAGNVMAVESKQALNSAENQLKIQNSDHTSCSQHKDIVKGSEDQPINVTVCNAGIAEKVANRKKKHQGIWEENNMLTALSKGNVMQSVAGIEILADNVGQALQFLEFCSAFEQVLDLKKGQPESVLRELVRGRIGRRGMYSSVVQFHVKLLSLIEEDNGEQCEISHSGSGENSWVQALKRLVMKKLSSINEDSLLPSSNSTSDEQHKMRQKVCEVDSFIDASLRGGAEGYETLDPSRKLRLLNILCDESLSTQYLRHWIDSANNRFIESKKEHQEEVMAAKEKAKEAKQKMKDEVARILLSSKDGAFLTINEHDDLISRVKYEADRAQAAKLEVLEAASRMKRQRCDAIRTEPIVWDKNGRVYWRLKGGLDRSVVLLQDIGSWKPLVGQDQWFIYNEEEEKILTQYISLSRAHKAGKQQQNRVSAEPCKKVVESEPVCAIEIVLDECTPNAGK